MTSKALKNVEKLNDIINVRDFGADPSASAAVNTAAIQAAIDFALVKTGGGTVEIIGAYNINGSLSIGSQVQLVGPGRLTQITNNIPIIRVNKSTFMQGWGIRKLELRYQNQQTASDTNANALVLCEANQFSYSFIVEDVRIWQAHTGILAPELTGNFAFLATFNNVVIEQCSSWGFDWLNAISGGSTYLSMNNVWVNNIAGLEIAGSKGFRIRGCASLCINSIGIDHVQDQPVYLESSVGNIGVITVESCDLSRSGTGQIYLVLMTGGSYNIGEISLENNPIVLNDSAEGTGVRVSDGAFCRVGVLRDNFNAVSGSAALNYGTANAATTADALYIDDYFYGPNPVNPAPNGKLFDFNTPPKIRMFAQNVRRDVRGGKQHIFATAVPSTGTWAVGDTAWNTDPTASDEPIGWICTAAGTPGTWFPFGAPTTPTDSADNIAALANAINTTGKYAGKQVWDTTNNRMMRARGGAAADPWDVIDGSASVTPS